MKKLKKRSGFVINSNLKDSAFKEVKRDAKYVKGVPFFNRRYMKGVPFLYKMVKKCKGFPLKRIRGSSYKTLLSTPLGESNSWKSSFRDPRYLYPIKADKKAACFI